MFARDIASWSFSIHTRSRLPHSTAEFQVKFWTCSIVGGAHGRPTRCYSYHSIRGVSDPHSGRGGRSSRKQAGDNGWKTRMEEGRGGQWWDRKVGENKTRTRRKRAEDKTKWNEVDCRSSCIPSPSSLASLLPSVSLLPTFFLALFPVNKAETRSRYRVTFGRSWIRRRFALHNLARIISTFRRAVSAAEIWTNDTVAC